MAFSFGDLNIPSSRAFWDDCDEDECPTDDKPIEALKLIYQDDYDESLLLQTPAELLVCIEGDKISSFVEHTLLGASAGFTKLFSIPPKNSSVHWHAGQKILIAALDDDLNSSGEVSELLLPIAKSAKRVITVTVKPKVEFKTERLHAIRDEFTFIRSLDSEVEGIPILETPNFIAGVAAGIASWRETNGLHVSTYVAYTDNIALDAQAAEPIIQLLSKLGLQPKKGYQPKKKDLSHLYA